MEYQTGHVTVTEFVARRNFDYTFGFNVLKTLLFYLNY